LCCWSTPTPPLRCRRRCGRGSRRRCAAATPPWHRRWRAARTPVSAYAADLARIHHEAYGFLARAAAPVVLDALAAAHPSGLIVDLGCGSGITAAALVDAGYDVLGVDASPDMIALARRTAPGARFAVGSAHAVRLPACVAVTAIGEVVGYAEDPVAPAPSLARLARRVY